MNLASLGIVPSSIGGRIQLGPTHSWFRKFRANLHYLRKPLVDILPLVLVVLLILLIGGHCFHDRYQGDEIQRLSFARALFITYCLIFMEHLVPFPEDDLVLQFFYYLLPPLGLVVILDGLVRFGYHILRREEHGREWVSSMAKTYQDHVILCGLGRVGRRVLEQLLVLGEHVVILEKNTNNVNVAFARNNNVPLMFGNGREEGMFDSLNVAQAKSIILATDDDLANLEMALDARLVQPGIRVVMRMFDQELASKIRGAFDLQLAFSTAAQSAPLFATCSSDQSIENAFYVGDQLLVVANLEVLPGSEFADQPISFVGGQENIFVLAHKRSGHVAHFPDSETILRVHDHVTVQTSVETLKTLHGRNHSNQDQ